MGVTASPDFLGLLRWGGAGVDRLVALEALPADLGEGWKGKAYFELLSAIAIS